MLDEFSYNIRRTCGDGFVAEALKEGKVVSRAYRHTNTQCHVWIAHHKQSHHPKMFTDPAQQDSDFPCHAQ